MYNNTILVTKFWTLVILFLALLQPLSSHAQYPESSSEKFYNHLIQGAREVADPNDVNSFLHLDLSRYSDEKLVLYIQQLEQMAFARDLEQAVVPRLELRMAIVGKEISKRLQERADLRLIEASPEHTNSLIVEEVARLKAYRQAHSPAETCSLLRLQYAQTIIRMSSLKPSRSNLPAEPLTEAQKQWPEYEQDQHRAFFEMRLFLQIRFLGSLIKGTNCYDLLFPTEKILSEIWSRYNFAKDGVVFKFEGKDLRITRWPIGRSIAMCGRPYSTHFMDQTFFDDPGRADIDVPGLQMKGAYKQIDAYEQALRDFDAKYLFAK